MGPRRAPQTEDAKMVKHTENKSNEPGLSLEITSTEMKILLENAGKGPGLEKLLKDAPVVGKNHRLTLQEEEWENLAGLLSKTAFSMESSRRLVLVDNLIDAIEDLLLMDDGEDETD